MPISRGSIPGFRPRPPERSQRCSRGRSLRVGPVAPQLAAEDLRGVAAQGTLVVPVIHDADRKDVDAIAPEIEELAGRAGAGTITSPDLAGGTFTVIDMSEQKVSRFTPVINRGQAATLGAGTEALTLSCDNRIVQGTEGAEFLDRLRTLLGPDQ